MQTKIQSIKFNFVMNLILTASNFIFPLITIPYITGVLQADLYGKVNFANTVLQSFSLFAALGIPTYGIRVCAQVRDNKQELSKTVHELLIISFISTAIAYMLFFWSLFAVQKFSSEKELFLINSISLILNTLGISWFYSALEQYSYITIRSLVFKVISLVLMLLLVHSQKDYMIYAVILVLSTGGSNIMNIIHLRHFITLKPMGHYNLKKHIKPVVVFMGITIATSVYVYLDTVMLGFMQGDTQVGYYNIAVKVKLLLISLVTSLGAVLIPRLSYYIQNGLKEEFNKVIIKSFNFIIIFASAVSVYFIIFARETVLMLTRGDYSGAILPLQIIMPTILFVGISSITGLQMLTPLMKENKMLISYIIASVVNVILNFIFIPVWKASGTAFSTCITELTVVLVQCYFLVPVLKKIAGHFSFIKAGVSLLLSSAFIILLKYSLQTHLLKLYDNKVGILFILVMTSLLFFGLDFLLLLIMKESFICETVLPTLQNIIKKLKQHV
jgi:O-antigen/teichoic acid export membrane protein